MLSFDELKSMSDSERISYLHEESEKLILSAAPHNQLKLRSLQAKCDGIRRTHKNHYLACLLMVNLMLESAESMGAELGKL